VWGSNRRGEVEEDDEHSEHTNSIERREIGQPARVLGIAGSGSDTGPERRFRLGSTLQRTTTAKSPHWLHAIPRGNELMSSVQDADRLESCVSGMPGRGLPDKCVVTIRYEKTILEVVCMTNHGPYPDGLPNN
jgi:hypothetical protein